MGIWDYLMQYKGMRGETNESMNNLVYEDRVKAPLVCYCSKRHRDP